LQRETLRNPVYVCVLVSVAALTLNIARNEDNRPFLIFSIWQIFFLGINETQFGDRSKNKLELLPGQQQVEY